MSDTKKVRFVRVEEALWDSAMRKARSEGTTLSEVMRGLLADYAQDRSAADDLDRAITRLNALHRRLDVDIDPFTDRAG